MNFKTKFILTFGESAGAVLASALVVGTAWSLMRMFFIYLLKRVGIDYFAEMAESFRWVGQIVIEARHALNADRACFYRCSNGKFYLENDTLDSNKNIRVYSVANKTKNKGVSPLPEVLDKSYFEWFLQLQKEDSYLEQFTPDLPIDSQLRNNLRKYDILSYLSVKIKSGNELYGILVFTWHDEKDMPKNLIARNREYLDDLKNTLLLETLFVIDRALRFKIRKLLRLDK